MPTRSRGVTSIDVAKAAGVSQTTVSRILNGHTGVSEKTQKKVADAIDRLGYRPNLSARSLVTSRTQTVGVVLGDLTNSYYAELLHTMSGELNAGGYRTLILSDRAGSIEDLRTTLWETNVDGVIVATTLLSPENESRIVSLGVPSVTLSPDPAEGTDSIGPDNLTGGRLAARHLLDLGHRRIGVIAGPISAGSVRDRHRGFLAELADRGVDFDESLMRFAHLDYTLAYEAAHSLMSLPDAPTALFCHNDPSALGALNAAIALGVRVPEDISVLGFDDIAMSSWNAFRLTTVRQPIREMAAGAVELILDRLAHPEREARRVILPCTLIERTTTAVLT